MAFCFKRILLLMMEYAVFIAFLFYFSNIISP